MQYEKKNLQRRIFTKRNLNDKKVSKELYIPQDITGFSSQTVK